MKVLIFLISFLLIQSAYSWNPFKFLRVVYCETFKSYGNCDCYMTCGNDENPACIISKDLYNPNDMTQIKRHAKFFANFCLMENYLCQHPMKFEFIDLKNCF
ncbi:hypothetical protein ACKWTF_006111 [Chironomus riparius]